MENIPNGYKMTEVGVIPEDWEVEEIKNISEKIYIGLVTTMTTNYVETGKGIPLIRNSDIKQNKIRTEGMINLDIKFAEANNDRRLKIGDIVTVHTGDIGTSAIINEELNGAHGFATLNTRLNTKIVSNKYVAWFLNSELYKKQAYSFSTGDGRNNLNLKDFIKSLIPYPKNITEQQKIAEILSTVDEQIETVEAQIEKAKELKKGLMQKLLTKGIGHTKFKMTELGEIPESWEVKRLGEVFERNIRRNNENNSNVLTISGKYGLVSQLEFFNKSVSSKDLSNYYLVYNGEFAYNKSYSEGYPLGAIKQLQKYEKGVVSSLYICFRKKGTDIWENFYMQYFEAGITNKQISTIAPEGGRSHGLLNVTPNDFFNILIHFPPLHEQQKIAEILSAIDEQIEAKEHKKEKLTELKNGLMQLLLTGKKRVLPLSS